MTDQTTEAVFNFILKFLTDNGFSPNQREIAAGCYMARSAVLRHLDKLEGRGRIIREPGMARSIRLPKPTTD